MIHERRKCRKFCGGNIDKVYNTKKNINYPQNEIVFPPMSGATHSGSKICEFLPRVDTDARYLTEIGAYPTENHAPKKTRQLGTDNVSVRSPKMNGRGDGQKQIAGSHLQQTIYQSEEISEKENIPGIKP